MFCFVCWVKISAEDIFTFSFFLLFFFLRKYGLALHANNWAKIFYKMSENLFSVKNKVYIYISPIHHLLNMPKSANNIQSAQNIQPPLCAMT